MSEPTRKARPTTADLARALEAQRLQLEHLEAHILTVRAFLYELGITHQRYEALFPGVLAGHQQQNR